MALEWQVQKWAKLLRKWICIFMQLCFMKMINISILHIKPSHVTNIYHLSFNLVFQFKFVFMIVKTWRACLIWGLIQCLKIHSSLIICNLHLSSFEDIGWVLAGEIYLKSFRVLVFKGNCHYTFVRQVEEELFPCLRRFGIAFYAYNPVSQYLVQINLCNVSNMFGVTLDCS